jgi:Domain of unknown function (DUF4296)
MRIIIVFFLLFFSACSNVPRGILEQEKMEGIMWEQMQADAFTREFISRDGTKKLTDENLKIQQQIFAKYDTDKESFYKSYQYYLKHEDALKPLLDSIVSKQTRIKQKEEERKFQASVKRDWRQPFIIDTGKTKKPYKLKGIIVIDDTFKKITPQIDSLKLPAIKKVDIFKRKQQLKEKPLEITAKEI